MVLKRFPSSCAAALGGEGRPSPWKSLFYTPVSWKPRSGSAVDGEQSWFRVARGCRARGSNRTVSLRLLSPQVSICPAQSCRHGAVSPCYVFNYSLSNEDAGRCLWPMLRPLRAAAAPLATPRLAGWIFQVHQVLGLALGARWWVMLKPSPGFSLTNPPPPDCGCSPQTRDLWQLQVGTRRLSLCPQAGGHLGPGRGHPRDVPTGGFATSRRC